MSTSRTALGRNDQIEALYREIGAKLPHLVRSHARTSEANVEDACGFAWAQLSRRPDIDLSCMARAIGWMRVVAVREAWRLHNHRERQHLDLDDIAEIVPASYVCEDGTGAARVEEGLTVVPFHERVVFVLHLAGYTYAEMAEREHLTLRVVNRRMVNARRRIRELE